jgi:hypothetical protein
MYADDFPNNSGSLRGIRLRGIPAPLLDSGLEDFGILEVD